MKNLDFIIRIKIHWEDLSGKFVTLVISFLLMDSDTEEKRGRKWRSERARMRWFWWKQRERNPMLAHSHTFSLPLAVCCLWYLTLQQWDPSKQRAAPTFPRRPSPLRKISSFRQQYRLSINTFFIPSASSSSLLGGGILLIEISLYLEDSIELIINFVFVLDIRSSSDVIKLEFQGSFLWTGGSSVILSPPSSLVVDRNQYCSFSFPHMPPCLPEYSSLRSTGSASMRRYPRTWSTGSAAARASASHKAGSGEVGAKITRIATAAPNEPARFPEMESKGGGVRRTEVHGSLCRGCQCIPPSAPIRGEHISDSVFK